MARFPKNPFAFRPDSYANIKRAFERRIARHHGFRNAPRAPAATNAATAKAPARDTLTRPDGMGLSGWFTASVARSKRSVRALPPAVKEAAAPAARRAFGIATTYPSGPTATNTP